MDPSEFCDSEKNPCQDVRVGPRGSIRSCISSCFLRPSRRSKMSERGGIEVEEEAEKRKDEKKVSSTGSVNSKLKLNSRESEEVESSAL